MRKKQSEKNLKIHIIYICNTKKNEDLIIKTRLVFMLTYK